MNTESDGRDLVVVGADGSPANEGALHWAAAEAAGVGADLLLVCALETSASIVRIPDALHQFEADARASLERDRQTVARSHPRLTTRALIVSGKAQPELVSHEHDAEMVVVGRRGHGRFTSLMLGSTSLATAGHAAGPVVVVPKDWRATDHGQLPIAVAVDVDHPDEPSLQFAFERCDRLGQPLRVIAAYNAPESFWNISDSSSLWKRLEQETNELLEKALAGYRAQFAEVHVASVVVQGHPAQAVLDATEGAELLVLGPRGRGTLGGFRVGSTTRAVLLHAKTPVAVVHPIAKDARAEIDTAG